VKNLSVIGNKQGSILFVAFCLVRLGCCRNGPQRGIGFGFWWYH